MTRALPLLLNFSAWYDKKCAEWERRKNEPELVDVPAGHLMPLTPALSYDGRTWERVTEEDR